MIVEWTSDEEQVDVADVIAAFPMMIHEAGITLRWTHKGETRILGWPRMRNAMDTYRDYEASRRAGRLQETPHVMLHWSEATPLLSAGKANVRLDDIPACRNSRGNSQ